MVPVAGLGTRMLPATKSQPKEMLPVGKKPIVQYVVEELVRSGIEQILFVTGRNKSSIENHFDFDHELMRTLRENGKEDLISELEYERMQAHFFYTRQRRQRGLGDAVLCAERFAGEEPFVVALGDSLIGLHANSSCVRAMISAYQSGTTSTPSRAEAARAGSPGISGVIAVEEVPHETVSHYGVVRPDGTGELFEITDLVEKPRPEQAPSNLAIAGRYILGPSIFAALRETPPDARGEIQLTDALRILRCRGERLLGLRLPPGERRYDIGNFQSYFETFLEFALADPEYAPGLKERLKTLLPCD